MWGCRGVILEYFEHKVGKWGPMQSVLPINPLQMNSAKKKREQARTQSDTLHVCMYVGR